MNMLIEAGFDTFIELGPGKVLTGLMKKINPAVYTAAVQDCASLEAVLEDLKGWLKKMLKLDNKVALVTGELSRHRPGYGPSPFAGRAAVVINYARNREAAEQLLAEVEGAGGQGWWSGRCLCLRGERETGPGLS